MRKRNDLSRRRVVVVDSIQTIKGSGGRGSVSKVSHRSDFRTPALRQNAETRAGRVSEIQVEVQGPAAQASIL